MITHAGASDLPILERAVGARPTALFDVQLAAGFVGLGLPSLGSLVSVLLGVRLDKSEQLADWSVRPLSPAVRKYAAADVEYLFPLTHGARPPLAGAGARGLGGERVRAAAQERRPAGRPRRRLVADQGRVVTPGREGARRAVRRRVARAARATDGPRPALRAARSGDGRGGRPSAEVARRRDEAARGQPHVVGGRARAARRGRGRAGDAAERAAHARQARRRPRARSRGRAARRLRRRDRPGATHREAAARHPRRHQGAGLRPPGRLDSGWRAEVAGAQLHRLLDGEAVIRLTDGGRHLRLEDCAIRRQVRYPHFDAERWSAPGTSHAASTVGAPTGRHARQHRRERRERADRDGDERSRPADRRERPDRADRERRPARRDRAERVRRPSDPERALSPPARRRRARRGSVGRRARGSAATRSGRTARASGSTGRWSPTPAS